MWRVSSDADLKNDCPPTETLSLLATIITPSLNRKVDRCSLETHLMFSLLGVVASKMQAVRKLSMGKKTR